MISSESVFDAMCRLLYILHICLFSCSSSFVLVRSLHKYSSRAKQEAIAMRVETSFMDSFSECDLPWSRGFWTSYLISWTVVDQIGTHIYRLKLAT